MLGLQPDLARALVLVPAQPAADTPPPLRGCRRSSLHPICSKKKNLTSIVTDNQESSRRHDDDAPLVRRAAAGDQRAYELLVIKYQRRIERLIRRIVRDVDLVPDIAQETFISAWRGLPKFRGDAQFYTWLYRIAINTAKRTLLGLKRDPLVTETALRPASQEDETYGLEDELTTESTPETELAAREVAGAVSAAIDELSEDLREAILLREVDGLSYEEIAQVMDCPIGTVRSRIFRAREAISEKIRPLLSHQSGKRW